MKTLVAALVCAATLVAQDPPPEVKPSAEHLWLKQLVGEWQMRAESTGFELSESTRAIGNFWTQSTIRGEFMGQPYRAEMMLGFDVQKKRFVGSWVDTTSPHLWHYNGWLDETKRVLTLEAEGPSFTDPTKMAKYRDMITFDANGRRSASSAILGDDGKWTTFQNATYTRTTATETATLAGGCFWCIEAVLDRIEGISDVESGYMGGNVDNPTYKQICTGTTGRAEVVQFRYDPAVISFDTVLDYFFAMHDPTTLNRQGNDVGTQYRSAVFFHSGAQQKAALAAIERAQKKYRDPIVTEITKASKYWPAEKYHQDYWAKNPADRYCNAFIPPKLEKLGLDKKKNEKK